VNRLDVQTAQIYSSRGGAVDVFVVRSSRADTAEIARIRTRLPRQLDDLLDGRSDPDALVAAARGGGIARPEPAVRAEVQLDDDASHTATVVEVFGRDRPGFLYGVTRALHREGVGISLAKVNTEGRRAADTFYVTEADGAKLSTARAEAVRASLLAVVEA
jgi:[protein-PII] uridylyltransferase